ATVTCFVHAEAVIRGFPVAGVHTCALPIYNPGTLTVTPRDLAITATSFNKPYGTTYAFAGTEFTTHAGDLVNGNTVTSVSLSSRSEERRAGEESTDPSYPNPESNESGHSQR